MIYMVTEKITFIQGLHNPPFVQAYFSSIFDIHKFSESSKSKQKNEMKGAGAGMEIGILG